MTTRARISAGDGRGPVRARGVGKGRALVGRQPCGRGEPTPGGCPRTARPVAARRYAPSGTAVAHCARVRLARPTAPRIVLPVKITVKGAPSGRVWRRRTNRAALEQ
jgi:hypothetical protein